MSDRAEDIDFIKGIMIFLMVCFHINVGSLSTITSWIYSFHMPVFLFYSGYFISTSKSIGQRVRNLIRSLVVPYVVFELIYISMLYFAGQLGFKFSNRVETLSVQFITNKIFLNPIGAYWYLHTLIISILAVYLIEFFAIINLTSRIILIGLLCYLFSSIISGLKFENEIFFVFGYFFKLFSYDILSSSISLVCILVIFLFGDTQRGSISSIGNTFFVISFLKYFYHKLGLNVFVETFKFFGRNTLIIVVLHPIFLNGFKVFERIFVRIDSTLIIYSLINTSFTICLSLLAAVIFDKIQISNLLFGKTIYVPYHKKSKV